MALLHNSGLPDRYRWDRNEFNKLEEHIKAIVDTGLVPAGHSTNDVLGECFEMFAAATQVRGSDSVLHLPAPFYFIYYIARSFLHSTPQRNDYRFLGSLLLVDEKRLADSLTNGLDCRKECSEHVRASREPEAFPFHAGTDACEKISQDRLKDVVVILVGLLV